LRLRRRGRFGVIVASCRCADSIAVRRGPSASPRSDAATTRASPGSGATTARASPGSAATTARASPGSAAAATGPCAAL